MLVARSGLPSPLVRHIEYLALRKQDVLLGNYVVALLHGALLYAGVVPVPQYAAGQGPLHAEAQYGQAIDQAGDRAG